MFTQNQPSYSQVFANGEYKIFSSDHWLPGGLCGSIAGALPQQEVDKCHDKLM